MDPRKNSRPLALVALSFAVAAPASAGLNLGAYASWTNTGTGGGFVDDADYGSGFGNYVASVTGASANLGWYATTSTFTGFADGGDGVIAKSQGIAEFTFATDVTLAITYGMSQLVGTGNQVGWGLVDATSGESVLGLSFDNGSGVSVGGVSLDADGSHTGSIAAGTYWLVMLAECQEAGGFFAYDATFTAVPGPGAIVLLGAFPGIARRRRHRAPANR